MSIKKTAYHAYFQEHPEEEEFAKRLDEAFDVTFGSMHGGLSFWLADPKQNVRERFGLQKEILVIYCPHKSTDARVLTAIENLSRSPDFKHRIDRVLFLLIHQGEDDEANSIASTDPDKVIVPFGVKELMNPGRGSIFIRSRIAERFGDIDLFGMSSPITSDHYFLVAKTLFRNSSFVRQRNAKIQDYLVLERQVKHQCLELLKGGWLIKISL